MGFQKGSTIEGGIIEGQRRAVLGQAMDMNALTWLLILCKTK
jgi:hypothetical protein